MTKPIVYLKPQGQGAGYRRIDHGDPDAWSDGFGSMAISVSRGSDGTVRAVLHDLTLPNATPALTRAILKALGEVMQ